MISIVTALLSVSTASSVTSARKQSWVISSTRRGLERSMIVPVSGPSRKVGPRSQTARMPSSQGEALSRHISQPSAIEWIQLPMTSGT